MKKIKNVLQSPVLKGSELTEFEPPNQSSTSSTIPSSIEQKEGDSEHISGQSSELNRT